MSEVLIKMLLNILICLIGSFWCEIISRDFSSYRIGNNEFPPYFFLRMGVRNDVRYKDDVLNPRNDFINKTYTCPEIIIIMTACLLSMLSKWNAINYNEICNATMKLARTAAQNVSLNYKNCVCTKSVCTVAPIQLIESPYICVLRLWLWLWLWRLFIGCNRC